MHQAVFSHLKKTRKTFDVMINYHLTNWLKILMAHITGTVSLVWHDISSTISLICIMRCICIIRIMVSWTIRTREWGEYVHCAKSIQIRIFFWSVFYCTRTEYRKIQTRKNSVVGHFWRSGIFNLPLVFSVLMEAEMSLFSISSRNSYRKNRNNITSWLSSKLAIFSIVCNLINF